MSSDPYEAPASPVGLRPASRQASSEIVRESRRMVPVLTGAGILLGLIGLAGARAARVLSQGMPPDLNEDGATLAGILIWGGTSLSAVALTGGALALVCASGLRHFVKTRETADFRLAAVRLKRFWNAIALLGAGLAVFLLLSSILKNRIEASRGLLEADAQAEEAPPPDAFEPPRAIRLNMGLQPETALASRGGIDGQFVTCGDFPGL